MNSFFKKSVKNPVIEFGLKTFQTADMNFLEISLEPLAKLPVDCQIWDLQKATFCACFVQIMSNIGLLLWQLGHVEVV